jgi:anti-sigma28 factor (negative regulator of flagellin synthesis)
MEETDPIADEFTGTLSAAATAVDTPVSKHSAERIAELRRRYQSGEYQPNAKDVASKLIDEHLI